MSNHSNLTATDFGLLLDESESVKARVQRMAFDRTGSPQGLMVTFGGCWAFLPGSHIPKTVESKHLINKDVDVVFLPDSVFPNHLKVSMVCARKIVRTRYLLSLSVGSKITGTVICRTNFGYVLQVGPVKGSLHHRQLNSDHRENGLSKGTAVKCTVTAISLKKDRIQLSTRA